MVEKTLQEWNICTRDQSLRPAYFSELLGLYVENYEKETFVNYQESKVVLQRCPYKKLSWKYAANLQENTFWNLISAFRHGCSPVNLLHIFLIAFPKKTTKRLLLNNHRRGYLSYLCAHQTLFECFNIDFTSRSIHQNLV